MIMIESRIVIDNVVVSDENHGSKEFAGSGDVFGTTWNDCCDCDLVSVCDEFHDLEEKSRVRGASENTEHVFRSERS